MSASGPTVLGQQLCTTTLGFDMSAWESSSGPHVVPTALSLQLLGLNSDLHLKAFIHVAARKFWRFFWRSTP